jgi:Holliday junction resolvase RusA-like endonuclease
MSAVYRLFVQGRPAAQPRARKGKHGNIYNPDTADAWKEAVQANVLAAGRKAAILGPVSLTVVFFFYAPEKRRREPPHAAKPDIDNLVKPVMDALKGAGVYKDDCQVCAVYARKHWTNDKEREGMSIRVSEAGWNE